MKIWQEWKRRAFMRAHLHVWRMFIKPPEIKTLLYENGFDWKGHTASQPNVPIPKMLRCLRKRARGQISFEQLGRIFWLVESKDMNILYAGHAIKKVSSLNKELLIDNIERHTKHTPSKYFF